MKQHLRIRVSGKVQGVFFRASILEVATKLKVNGFVRNEPDGSVFIEAEGDTESLDKLKAWCQEGPAGARVDEVIVSSGAFEGYTTFVIKY